MVVGIVPRSGQPIYYDDDISAASACARRVSAICRIITHFVASAFYDNTDRNPKFVTMCLLAEQREEPG